MCYYFPFMSLQAKHKPVKGKMLLLREKRKHSLRYKNNVGNMTILKETNK